MYEFSHPAEQKTIKSLPQNTIENVMNLMGIVLVLMETIMGVYWYVMDYIGRMLNPIGKMPKQHYKNMNFVWF